MLPNNLYECFLSSIKVRKSHKCISCVYSMEKKASFFTNKPTTKLDRT